MFFTSVNLLKFRGSCSHPCQKCGADVGHDLSIVCAGDFPSTHDHVIMPGGTTFWTWATATSPDPVAENKATENCPPSCASLLGVTAETV
jgi:hypothetical protein